MHNLFILKKHTLHTTLHFASPACSDTITDHKTKTQPTGKSRKKISRRWTFLVLPFNH